MRSMPPAPYGDPLQHEPGSPAPVTVIPAPTRLQIISTAAASLGASAVSIASILAEAPHAPAHTVPVIAVGGLVAAAAIGRRIIPERKRPELTPAERLEDERQRVIKKMRQGEIPTVTAQSMLALMDEERRRLNAN